MGWAQDVVRVRVPATSANLGPGFDALGLALTLHDDVEAWVRPAGISIEISGEGSDLADADEGHLVVQAMRAAFALTGCQPPGIGLRCVNRIPHGRGLGSSAAAIAAGLLAARALAGADGSAGEGYPPRESAAPAQSPGALSDNALLSLATELEGHPDNVAACLAGGLTIAWTTAGRPQMVRLETLPWITPVVCIAPAPVGTHVARGMLPELVPHRDAAANAGRSALLIAALTQPPTLTEPPALIQPPTLTHRPAQTIPAAFPPLDGASVLFDATEDWLHQGYRSAAMPETDGLVRRLRSEGIAAVVSGAGPSVLALLWGRETSDYRHHLDRLGSIVRETGIAWRISSLDVERHGARVLSPEPSPGY